MRATIHWAANVALASGHEVPCSMVIAALSERIFLSMAIPEDQPGAAPAQKALNTLTTSETRESLGLTGPSRTSTPVNLSQRVRLLQGRDGYLEGLVQETLVSL